MPCCCMYEEENQCVVGNDAMIASSMHAIDCACPVTVAKLPIANEDGTTPASSIYCQDNLQCSIAGCRGGS
jgi:hypothetical protein